MDTQPQTPTETPNFDPYECASRHDLLELAGRLVAEESAYPGTYPAKLIEAAQDTIRNAVA